MIKDRISGNEIRVVTSDDPDYPVTIQEFFKGLRVGFIKGTLGTLEPHKVTEFLFYQGRITSSDRKELDLLVKHATEQYLKALNESALEAAKALGALVHPSKRVHDRVNGHEIRVVSKSETGTPGLLGPPSINEFVNGENRGLYCPAQSLNPRDVLERLLKLGRINQDEHTALTIEVDQVQRARAHPVRVPDIKHGHEFSIGTDGHAPVVVMHHKNTDDFIKSYVLCEGCYDAAQVLDYLKLHRLIDGDGYRMLFEQLRKAEA